ADHRPVRGVQPGRSGRETAGERRGVVEQSLVPWIDHPDQPIGQNAAMSEPRYSAEDADRALAAVRAACLRLPEVTERPSHGSPAFFVREKKCFVMFLD